MTTECYQPNPIVVVTGADENYSIGLAVTVRSMLYHLGADRRIQLHVLDGGIEPETQERLRESWLDPRLTVVWHDVDMCKFSRLVIAGHLNHSTYLRLLIPDVVADDVGKVIYLDSDLLIRRDIGLMWDEPLGESSILAAAELSTPYVDSTVVFANQPAKYSRLGTSTPISNYRDLGFDPHAKVFNAGILVVNVAKWRRDNVPAKLCQCLESYREHVLFCDQYALNVVLHDQWREIDSRWNQNAHFYTYKTCQRSPLDQATFDSLVKDPWICHFTWIHKPWFSDCKHPFFHEFLTRMRETAWVDHELIANPALQRNAHIDESTDSSATRSKRTMRQWFRRRRDRIGKQLARLGILPSNPSQGQRAA